MKFKVVELSTLRHRSASKEAFEVRTSEQLVAIIDILLGLTLIEGALGFRSMFIHTSSANGPAVLAMVLVYVTAIWSFIDWHVAMQVVPYRVQTDGMKGKEMLRVAVDFTLMASYSFLILRAHALIADPGADLLALAITYTAIYLGYIFWGWLRGNALAADGLQLEPFSRRLLWLCVAGSGLLLVLYATLRHDGRLGLSPMDFNILFLAFELALYCWYRVLNSLQQLTLKGDVRTPNSVRRLQLMEAINAMIYGRGVSAEQRTKLESLKHAAAELDSPTLGELIRAAGE